jgi:hypothetical protein
MTTRLDNLEITELSLVDRPANPLAKVTIFKSADGLPHRNISVTKANPVRTAREASERIEALARQRASSGVPDKAEDDFLAAVEQFVERDGVSRVEAMRRARRQHPEKYAAYQREGREAVAKAARPKAVEKSEHVTKFETLIDNIQLRDRCSRLDALRKARREHPEAFAAFQVA